MIQFYLSNILLLKICEPYAIITCDLIARVKRTVKRGNCVTQHRGKKGKMTDVLVCS